MTGHGGRVGLCAGLSLERELWRTGYRAIAGADEVGRGAWAGPVVAAAVILPPDPQTLASLLGQVDDSKRLSPRARERALDLIMSRALAIGLGFVAAGEIDCGGILTATTKAMTQAVASLALRPDFLLLDYLDLPAVSCPRRAMAHGDGISLSIAAASVVAKVHRDRWMVEQDARHPGYGFARHKGYGTAEHRAVLDRLGPCALHRMSFRPVEEAVARRSPAGAGERDG